LKGAGLRGVKQSDKTMAQSALAVYETLCTRPPGWAATTGFLFIHVGGIALALVLTLVLMVAQGGGFARFARAAANQPKHSISSQEIVVRYGGHASEPSNLAHKTLIANFPRIADATAAFRTLAAQLPPGQEIER